MEIVLLIWFVLTSLGFIAFVIYDLKPSTLATVKSKLNEPIALTSASSRPTTQEINEASEAEQAAWDSLQLLYQHINRWDWQQAVANLISSLKISASGELPVVALPEPRHSFPRQMIRTKNDFPTVLHENDLLEAVADYRLKTNRPLVEIWGEIREQVESFSNTRDSLKQPRNIHGSVSGDMELRADLRDKLNEVRSKYAFFNASEPLHEDQLKHIFNGEEIAVHYIENLELLSLFVEYGNKGNKRRAVVIRKDGVHQAVREFLLGHELGHWFLHFESGFAENLIGENYYLHSSLEWQPLETDADTFAMTALFPTPYLADFENFEGSLSAERLFDAFTLDMDKIESEGLRDVMLSYIRKRIERYNRFKETILPVRIPVPSVQVEDVEALLHFSNNTELSINWVQMDKNFVIVRASQSFLKLFDLPAEEIIGKLKPLDLVVPEEQEALQQRFLRKLHTGRAMFYFTRIKSSSHGGGRRVAVNSLPILRGQEYAGSIGYLIFPEQIPVTSLDATTLHTS